jgi:DNA gyrase subunit A
MTDTLEGRNENIIDHSLVEEMQDSYLTYSMSVIMARALPDIRDGLKPSQRRILVAMNDLNLTPRAQTKKCSKISGDTSGNYHPHGDAVIYPTLVRLAQTWNMRQTLIEGQGNFGSIDGDPPAAMRYTEARMTAASIALLDDLESDTVDFVPNYDNSRTEPTVLPGRFPNLLVNGAQGIAVGMATNIPPHNAREVCEALLMQLDDPSVPLAKLMTVLPGPDFPTGGIICGRTGIEEAYRTGRGSVVIRGRVHVEEGRGGKQTVVIDEVPYGVLRSTITERIAAAVKAGTIREVSAVNDASDRKHPVRIEVDLRRDANEEVVINQLYQYTPLQSSFHIQNIALVERRPQTLTLKQMLACYITHRQEVIRRRTQFLLRKAKQKAHLLEGLILAVGDIDAIIELIKTSPDPAAAKERLMARPLRLVEHDALRRLLPEAFVTRYRTEDYLLTAVQAGAILTMQLQRLTGLEIEKLAKEYAELVREIEGYEAILRDERLVLDIIREDVHELKEKFPDKRRTEITGEVSAFSMEELIPDEQVVVTVTREGYIKRTDIDSYRKQGRGGRGVRGTATKEGDFLQHVFVVSTHDYLLIFTDMGRVYWTRVFDAPVAGRASRGRSLANLVKMRESESTRAILAVRAFEEAYVFFATRSGVVKKTPIAAFSRPRADGIIAIGLDDGDTLINVERTSGEDEIVIGTRKGMAIRFAETDVRAMGRGAHGVRGMTLEEGDGVVSMAAIHPGASLLTVCAHGYGKRTNIEDYRKTRRGGKGVINIRATERNGEVVALVAVDDDDELMIVTAKGITLRTGLEAVREIGRATQGVRLIRPDEGDKVVAVEKIPVDADEEERAGTDRTAAPSAGGDHGRSAAGPLGRASRADDATRAPGPAEGDTPADEDEDGEEEDDQKGEEEDDEAGEAEE